MTEKTHHIFHSAYKSVGCTRYPSWPYAPPRPVTGTALLLSSLSSPPAIASARTGTKLPFESLEKHDIANTILLDTWQRLITRLLILVRGLKNIRALFLCRRDFTPGWVGDEVSKNRNFHHWLIQHLNVHSCINTNTVGWFLANWKAGRKIQYVEITGVIIHAVNSIVPQPQIAAST
jgi:hypothetical protein